MRDVLKNGNWLRGRDVFFHNNHEDNDTWMEMKWGKCDKACAFLEIRNAREPAQRNKKRYDAQCPSCPEFFLNYTRLTDSSVTKTTHLLAKYRHRGRLYGAIYAIQIVSPDISERFEVIHFTPYYFSPELHIAYL